MRHRAEAFAVALDQMGQVADHVIEAADREHPDRDPAEKADAVRGLLIGLARDVVARITTADDWVKETLMASYQRLIDARLATWQAASDNIHSVRN